MKRGFDNTEDGMQKKLRETPTKVVHFRGLPASVTEGELVTLSQPFGNVARILILESKKQAFVQFATQEGAAALVNTYDDSRPATIRGKSVYVQFSNRDEITIQQRAEMPFGSGGQNSILLLTIRNVQTPITLETIYSVFCAYGTVLKIVIFMSKGDTMKALVQMGTVDQAERAIQGLDGREMYYGCCLLELTYSKLPTLEVKTNGPRSWDFTQSNDLSMAGMGPVRTGAYSAYGVAGANPSSGVQGVMGGMGLGGMGLGGMGLATGGPGSVLLVNNLLEGQVDCNELFTLFGVYGNVIRVKILYNKRSSAMVEFDNAEHAQNALNMLNHVNFKGQEMIIATSKYQSISIPRDEEELTCTYIGSPLHRFRSNAAGPSKHARNIHPPARVLHVSNLHDGADDSQLEQVFGSDVQVQFFEQNRKMALVKMATVDAAVDALVQNHNRELGGRHLRISFSPKDLKM